MEVSIEFFCHNSQVGVILEAIFGPQKNNKKNGKTCLLRALSDGFSVKLKSCSCCDMNIVK